MLKYNIKMKRFLGVYVHSTAVSTSQSPSVYKHLASF